MRVQAVDDLTYGLALVLQMPPRGGVTVLRRQRHGWSSRTSGNRPGGGGV